MRTVITAALLVMLSASAVSADPPPTTSAAAPPQVKQPLWIRTPTGDDFARVYPQAAWENRVSGRTVMACKIAADGRLDPCTVTEEDPPNLGFAHAGLELATRFQMKPQDRDGFATAGRFIVIPIRFRGPW